MLKPSPATREIRRIVEKMSDEDLRTKGPSDLREAVTKAGLVYEDVRDNVNNELARARRKRGIRKGRGRRIASEYPTDPEHVRLFRLFTRLDEFRTQFESWDHAREAIEDVISFIEGLGGTKELMEVIEMKRADEKADEEKA